MPVLEIHNALGVSWEVVDPDYYRKVLLKIYWDDQETPGVIAPLGDFFGLMNSLSGSYDSLPLSVSAKEPELHTFGGSAAFNSYFRMPFGSACPRRGGEPERHPLPAVLLHRLRALAQPLPEDAVYFHAHWRRALPNPGWGPDLQANSLETTVPTSTAPTTTWRWRPRGAATTWAATLAVRHFQGSWWGEGDDMIFIDDDTWPPSLHGTGMEDYFGHAWGMQHNAYHFNGTIVHEEDVPGFHHSYRFHLVDPIRFEKRIRVTFEHGHANHLSDDWSSTAYWYQTLPSPVLERARRGRAAAPAPGRPGDRGAAPTAVRRAARRAAPGEADGAASSRPATSCARSGGARSTTGSAATPSRRKEIRRAIRQEE